MSGFNMTEKKFDESTFKDIDRGIYDVIDKFEYSDISDKGLNKEIVEELSRKKNEPEWMLKRRLQSLLIFEQTENPSWGPDLSELNMADITTYVKPKTDKKSNWDALPEEIKDTFDARNPSS